MQSKIFVNKSQLEVDSSPEIYRKKLRSSLQDIVQESERDAVSERKSILFDQKESVTDS